MSNITNNVINSSVAFFNHPVVNGIGVSIQYITAVESLIFAIVAIVKFGQLLHLSYEHSLSIDRFTCQPSSEILDLKAALDKLATKYKFESCQPHAGRATFTIAFEDSDKKFEVDQEQFEAYSITFKNSGDVERDADEAMIIPMVYGEKNFDLLKTFLLDGPAPCLENLSVTDIFEFNPIADYLEIPMLQTLCFQKILNSKEVPFAKALSVLNVNTENLKEIKDGLLKEYNIQLDSYSKNENSVFYQERYRFVKGAGSFSLMSLGAGLVSLTPWGAFTVFSIGMVGVAIKVIKECNLSNLIDKVKRVVDLAFHAVSLIFKIVFKLTNFAVKTIASLAYSVIKNFTMPIVNVIVACSKVLLKISTVAFHVLAFMAQTIFNCARMPLKVLATITVMTLQALAAVAVAPLKALAMITLVALKAIATVAVVPLKVLATVTAVALQAIGFIAALTFKHPVIPLSIAAGVCVIAILPTVVAVSTVAFNVLAFVPRLIFRI